MCQKEALGVTQILRYIRNVIFFFLCFRFLAVIVFNSIKNHMQICANIFQYFIVFFCNKFNTSKVHETCTYFECDTIKN